MDPVSTIQSCIALAKELYALKKNIESDDAAACEFFHRIDSLNAPLLTLQSLPCDTLDVKKSALTQIHTALNEIQSIINTRVAHKKTIFGMLQNAADSYSGRFRSCLADLNIQLDRCIATLQLCVSVESTEDIKGLKVVANNSDKKLADLNTKMDELAIQLQGQLSGNAVESLYVRDPLPDDSDDERSILGEGAFAVTYRMKNTLDRGTFAVKVVKVAKAEAGGVSREVLMKEASYLQQLNHPNIVRYFTCFFSKKEKLFNVVMELVSGGTIASRIKDPSLTDAQIVKWLKQMASVLCYLHYDMNILHRDIKPENILLTTNNTIKLIDLGLASVVRSTTSVVSRVGTQLYASNEKISGLYYDGRDDVWATGCIFGELLTRSRLLDRGGAINMPIEMVNNRRVQLISDCEKAHAELGSLLRRMLVLNQDTRITSEELNQRMAVFGLSSEKTDTQHLPAANVPEALPAQSPKAAQEHSAATPQKPAVYATVLYDHIGVGPAEMNITEGETIQVLKQEEEWWYGIKVGELSTRGYFPGNYVKIIDAAQVHKIVFPTSSSGSVSTNSNGSEKGKAVLIDSGKSLNVKSQNDQMVAINAKSVPVARGRALYDFTSKNGLEITIKKGQTVQLIRIGEAGGWSGGINEEGQCGWFPSDYIEVLKDK